MATSIRSFPACLTVDFAADLFVNGGYVTEGELLENTYLLFGVFGVMKVNEM